MHTPSVFLKAHPFGEASTVNGGEPFAPIRKRVGGIRPMLRMEKFA